MATLLHGNGGNFAGTGINGKFYEWTAEIDPGTQDFTGFGDLNWRYREAQCGSVSFTATAELTTDAIFPTTLFASTFPYASWTVNCTLTLSATKSFSGSAVISVSPSRAQVGKSTVTIRGESTGAWTYTNA